VWIRVDEVELAELERRAAAAGVSVARYAIEAALARADTAAERRVRAAELLAVQRMIRGMATNINQLAKVANSNGGVPAGAAAALAALDQLSSHVETIANGACRDGDGK